MTDEAIIKIRAGKGGDGLISFRREKYVPKGGPDGGDGGNGGNIFLVCSDSLHTLTEYARKREWQAQNGQPGKSKRKHGKKGSDLEMSVPPGTIVTDVVKNEVLHDFTKLNDKFLIARGGNGGWGNVHFATSVHQTPLISKKGKPGEEKTLKFELKLIADVGLIGLPNSGKSTLLSHISNARPKIADYPFTTLEPNLGVAKFDKNELIFADIPGLISGASNGKGLGDKFLRHIERTKTLLHMIDINNPHLENDYQTIRHELRQWNPELSKKEEIVVLNKIDTKAPSEAEKIGKTLSKKISKKVYLISAVSGEGIKQLLRKLI